MQIPEIPVILLMTMYSSSEEVSMSMQRIIIFLGLLALLAGCGQAAAPAPAPAPAPTFALAPTAMAAATAPAVVIEFMEDGSCDLTLEVGQKDLPPTDEPCTLTTGRYQVEVVSQGQETLYLQLQNKAKEVMQVKKVDTESLRMRAGAAGDRQAFDLEIKVNKFMFDLVETDPPAIFLFASAPVTKQARVKITKQQP